MKLKIFIGLTSLWCGFLILESTSLLVAEEKDAAVDSTRQARMHLSFGVRYLRSKRHEDAERQLTKAWRFDPKNKKTAYYLGRLYHKLGKYGEATPWLKRSIELAPQLRDARSAYRLLAQLKEEKGEAEGVQAGEVGSGSGAVKHLSAGIRSLKSGQFGEAETELVKAWGLDPTNERIAYFLHKLYHESRDYDEAATWFGRWTKLVDPEDLERAAPAAPLDAFEIDWKPQSLSLVMPVYPKEAIKQELEGRVTLRVLVGLKGRVEKVEFIDGPEIFRESAVAAARLYRFRPGKHKGKAQKVWVTLPIEFNLPGSKR